MVPFCSKGLLATGNPNLSKFLGGGLLEMPIFREKSAIFVYFCMFSRYYGASCADFLYTSVNNAAESDYAKIFKRGSPKKPIFCQKKCHFSYFLRFNCTFVVNSSDFQYVLVNNDGDS